MNTKNILLGVGATVLVFVILFFVYQLTNKPIETYFPELNRVLPSDYTKWKKDSKNIIVEFTDFECPACRDRYLFLKDLEKTATPNAVFVSRNFPLYQVHPLAFQAAYAVESAGRQGKYWEMEDVLFVNQPQWSSLSDPKNYFIDQAKKLNLDVDKFQKDMSSQAVADHVQSDLSQGNNAGVNATPTFFLNGKIINVNTLDEFKQLLMSLK